MAFKIEKFGAEVSNAKSILGGISYYRYAMTNNDDITTAGYFPSKLGLKEGDRIWVTPKTKTDADVLYIVSNVSDAGVVTVVAAPSDTGQTIQVEELPEASADELGNIYQFVGTTGDTYTNGYFYKCTGAGEPVVYSWSQVDVQPTPEALPDQTGQSGKFLTTDGTDASWGTINALQNTATGTDSLTILGTATTENNIVNIGVNATAENGGTAIGKDALCVHNYGTAIGIGASVYGSASEDRNVAIGAYATAGESSSYKVSRCVVIGGSSQAARNGSRSVVVGNTSYSKSGYGVAIGCYAGVETLSGNGIAIGYAAKVSAANAIQIGSKGTNNNYTNSDANTFKVGNANGNFEIMSADGTIPAARHASLPAADGTYVLKLTISGGVPTLAWVAE